MNTILTLCFLNVLLNVNSYDINQFLPKGALETLPTMVEQYGYTSKEYSVITEDGYVLKLFQLKNIGVNKTQSLPVLILHGLGGTAEDFVRLGPKKSLGYMLADEGYEVWLGNLRGNIYTSHQKLSKNNFGYWNFTLDDFGIYDLPKMIETVVNVSCSPQLHYIGYSMGTTSYFIMSDKRPDFGKLVATFVGLAPIVVLGETYKIPFENLYKLGAFDALKKLKIGSINDSNIFTVLMSLLFCKSYYPYTVCNTVLFSTGGADYLEIPDDKVMEIALKMQPRCAKIVEHFVQNSIADTFAAYDWGQSGNLIKYKSEKPPKYDLTKIEAPTALFYGKNDIVATPKNVEKLYKSMKNNNSRFVMKKLLQYEEFNHNDFIVAKLQTRIVNLEIINTIPILHNSV